MSFDDDEIERIQRRKLLDMMRKRDSTAQDRGVDAQIPSGIVTLTDATFSDTIKRYKLTVVDFWAPWCGPCRFVSPIIEQLSEEYRGRVAFGKLNVDENPAVSYSYQIQGIPTIMLFSHGNVVDSIVGAVPRAVIDSRIKMHLGGTAVPYA